MITVLRTNIIVIKGIHLHGDELHTRLHRTAMTVLTPPGFREGKGPGPHMALHDASAGMNCPEAQSPSYEPTGA